MLRLRLQLKPEVPTAPYVDGAWWPRSLRLGDELPALLAAVSDRIGGIRLIVYQSDAWDEAPGHLAFKGEPVQLEGLESTGEPTVDIIGTDGQRLTLLVVPPDTPSAAALQSLTDASQPLDSDTVAGAAARALDEVTLLLAGHEGAENESRTAQIRAWVNETAEQFADAPVQSYVPILVEHIVRGRIDATPSSRES